MKRAIAWITVGMWLGAAVGSPAGPLRVTATTSLLASLLREVGGSRVQVSVLIPPASCPGHFDLRPGDVATIKRSGALFAHQFERFVDRINQLAGEEVKVYRIDVKGNWLVPATCLQASEQIAAVLSQIDRSGAQEYQRNLGRLRQRVRAVEHEMRKQLREAGVLGTPVVVSEMLEPLLRWMELKVVATYGRAEDLTPAEWHRVTTSARQAGVRLVIDNLQSGANTGAELARDLKADHVLLSNFPGGLPNTQSWEKCLREDVRRVVSAVSRLRQ